jgi:hypothetical protein
VVLGQEVGELLVGRLLEDGLLPQVGGEVGVCGRDGSIGSLGKVTQSSSRALGRGVAIINSSHLEQLLGDRGGDDAGTTGGRDQSHPDRAALASHLAGDGVGLAHLGSPEAPSDRDDGELGHDDGAADGRGHLLGALHTKTNMTVVVTDSCKITILKKVFNPNSLFFRNIFSCQESNHIDHRPVLLFIHH